MTAQALRVLASRPAAVPALCRVAQIDKQFMREGCAAVEAYYFLMRPGALCGERFASRAGGMLLRVGGCDLASTAFEIVHMG